MFRRAPVRVSWPNNVYGNGTVFDVLFCNALWLGVNLDDASFTAVFVPPLPLPAPPPGPPPYSNPHPIPGAGGWTQDDVNTYFSQLQNSAVYIVSALQSIGIPTATVSVLTANTQNIGIYVTNKGVWPLGPQTIGNSLCVAPYGNSTWPILPIGFGMPIATITIDVTSGCNNPVQDIINLYFSTITTASPDIADIMGNPGCRSPFE